MRIAVTGISGQVTRALQRLGSPDLQIVPLGRPDFDLTSPNLVRDCIRKASPHVIVSAAAYTAVDKAELDQEEAFSVNRDGPKTLAEIANEFNVPIIHLSTDYVFDGTKASPYNELDQTGPSSVYGQSKLEGEQAIAEVTTNHVILRTAWVYSIDGHNFLKTMLRLSETREGLSVVADQFGCPTSAADIADAIIRIAHRVSTDDAQALRGVFHLTGSGDTSWAEFARYIFSILAEKTGKRINVQDITTAQYPTAAKRPANSRLDCAKLETVYDIRLPKWQDSARQTVIKLLMGESA